MKDEKRKRFLLIILTFVTIAIVHSTGIASSGTGIKLGWREDTFGNKWSASYTYYTGIREKKLSVKKTDCLHLKVMTDKGKISIELQDTNGTVLYSEKNIKSLEKEIAVNGTVKAKITANGHKGGFWFCW